MVSLRFINLNIETKIAFMNSSCVYANIWRKAHHIQYRTSEKI